MTDRIIYQNSELYYYREGDGNKVILLFHGFGQDHRAFDSWIEQFENDYTIFTFDLFFHGNSKWGNQQALTKEDWKKILQLFLNQEKIQGFEIAGFSIGAKFVLATVELFPDRINKIILLAPDGIKNNFWYSLATSTSLMRVVFRSLILGRNRLKTLISLLKPFQDKGLLRFVESQLSTEEKRRRVYNSWIYFRHLNFNLKNLSVLLNSKNIPVIFILGKLDKVIPAKKIEGFAKSLK
ncbi:MAG TPA: alpha/beta hydrolase, partial [Cyclobacteriaceae bacterium]|nr:alpha/beta hydrolase [Cyclobacteriaceae bacterium]